MSNKLIKTGALFFLSITLAGCAFVFQTGRRSDLEKIQELSQKLKELESTRSLLEKRLAQEIKDRQVRLQMMDKGLVITFVADVLFDSGKAKIRNEAYPILEKVASVLKENVPDLKVGIEGHTDNEPIRVSGWRSNWELSTARALSILHYLTKEKGLAEDRFVVLGYGEYRPVASNATAEGRRLNRRVEIVIMPEIKKQKGISEKKILEPEIKIK
ncbi:MAG: OmpA family protein [Candidatus Omnitrophica bacterium]|nr:OmpA family protein [Candidatus Omnitrophota bacterium]